jgi:hypothetical protein
MSFGEEEKRTIYSAQKLPRQTEQHASQGSALEKIENTRSNDCGVGGAITLCMRNRSNGSS